MSGRRLVWPLVLVLVLVLVAHVAQARRQLQASRILRQVENTTTTLVAAGRGAPRIYWLHVELLEKARRLDPADSRIVLALGSQYLLLQRPQEAAKTYREALDLEARPEIYLNLGRAELAAGDEDAARESFRRAVLLDPNQKRLVPQELRPQ
ncbi:MAG: tetratricopeptide repeat protein [Acidobacteriota bacterium]